MSVFVAQEMTCIFRSNLVSHGGVRKTLAQAMPAKVFSERSEIPWHIVRGFETKALWGYCIDSHAWFVVPAFGVWEG